MSEGQTEDEKKEITEEGQETLDSVRSPVLIAVEDAGLPLDKWIKELVKLTRAKKSKPQKLKAGKPVIRKGKSKKDDRIIPAETQLAGGVKIKAATTEEILVEVPVKDNDTRLSALSLIGKATGWVDPDSMALKVEDPLFIEIAKEEDGLSVTHET